MPEAANSLEFRGTGQYNGSAASFRVCVQDNGEGSKAPERDRFYLECESGCTYETGSRTPDDSTDGGNVQVKRTTPVAQGGSTQQAPVATGAAQPSVLVLSPLLTTEGVVGQSQSFSVTVYDQYGRLLPSASVNLVRTSGGGTLSLPAVTNVLGTATVATTNVGQVADYRATAGSAESNTIQITPRLG